MMDRVRMVHKRADYAVAGAFALMLGGIVPSVALNLYRDDFVAEPLRPILVSLPDLPYIERARTFAAESECLAEAMYYEARGEGVAGETAVAEVVLQRVRDPHYPRTICGVVHEGAAPGHRSGCQFEFVCNTVLQKRRERFAWRHTEVLAVEILLGKAKLRGETGHAIAFHTVGAEPGWTGGMIQTAQIGNHVFYKRAPNAKPAAPAEATVVTEDTAPARVASEEIQSHI